MSSAASSSGRAVVRMGPSPHWLVEFVSPTTVSGKSKSRRFFHSSRSMTSSNKATGGSSIIPSSFRGLRALSSAKRPLGQQERPQLSSSLQLLSSSGGRRSFSSSTTTTSTTLQNPEPETTAMSLDDAISNNPTLPLTSVSSTPLHQHNEHPAKYDYSNASVNAAMDQGNFGGPQQPTTTTTAPARGGRYNIYDMDSRTIMRLDFHVEDLRAMVAQIVALPRLDADDIALLLPLTAKTSLKRYGRVGAELTETMLFHCLGHLPTELADRYHPDQIMVLDSSSSSSSTSASADTLNDNSESRTTSTHNINHTNTIRSKLPYPTVSMFNRAMIAWGSLGTTESAERTETIFQWQMQEYLRECDYLRKLRQSFWEEADGVSSSQQQQQRLYSLPLEPFAPPPDRRCFKSRIRAWAVAKTDERAPARAYEILQEMEQLAGVPALLQQHGNNRENRPYSYKTRQRDLQKQSEPTIPRLDLPDLATYNLVLGAYGRSHVNRHPTALNRVQQLVHHVDELQAVTQNDDYRLDGHSYLSILQAYQHWIAACPAPLDPQLVHQVAQLLQRIHDRIAWNRQQEQHQQQLIEEQSIDGDIPDYLLDNSNTNGNDGGFQSRRNRDRHLEQERNMDADRKFLFPLPMRYAYGALVDALLKTQPLSETAAVAYDILEALSGTSAPQDHSFRIRGSNGTAVPLITIPAEICEPGCCLPHDAVLIRLTGALERSGLPDAEQRIQHLLDLFVVSRSYTRTYDLNEALEAWCGSGWKRAPYLVELMLTRARGAWSRHTNKPTGESFAIVMRTWLRAQELANNRSHSRSNSASLPGREALPSQRIENIFQQMLHLFEHENDTWYRPREVHLRYLMQAWMNQCSTGLRYDGISGNQLYPAEHCENLIHMYRSRAWFDDSMQGIYAMVLRAWAIQRLDSNEDPNPLKRSVELLDALAESLPPGEKLPAFPCNWVLDVCGKPQPTEARRREAYQTAISTIERSKFNPRTFVLAAQVLRTQVGPVLDTPNLAAMEDLFRKACTCGMLTQDLIAHVAAVARPETLQRLFSISNAFAEMLVAERNKPQHNTTIPTALLVSNLPHEWSVHADTQRKRTPVPHRQRRKPIRQ